MKGTLKSKKSILKSNARIESNNYRIQFQCCCHPFYSGERYVTPFYCYTLRIVSVIVFVVVENLFPFGSKNAHMILLLSCFVFNREGRTETVRPCTMYSCAFVRAMLNPSSTVSNLFRQIA